MNENQCMNCGEMFESDGLSNYCYSCEAERDEVCSNCGEHGFLTDGLCEECWDG